jgi:hypothetical protein
MIGINASAARNREIRPPRRLVRSALVLSTVSSALFLGLITFEAQLMNRFTAFIVYPLEDVAGPLFLVCGVFSLVVLVMRVRTCRWQAALPLLVQVATVVVLATVPLRRIILDTDFRWNRKARERVVELVRTGQLLPPGYLQDQYEPGAGARSLSLPRELADLSEGGKIEIARAGPRPVVMFLTFRGILDHYAGFVYCEDGVSATDALFETSWKDSIEYGGHWYWVTR